MPPEAGTPPGDPGPSSAPIAMFGGTFDPPHLGHLAAAQDVHEALGLGRVLFVPAGVPPHKRDLRITDAGIRLRMVRAAVEGDPRMDVSALEVEREGPSWTVDTLRTLRERAPDRPLFLILGADQWASFGSWREPAEILRLATPVLLAREGEHPAEVDPGLPPGVAPPAGEVRELRVTRVDLSSSELRRRVREGRPIRYLVPEGVRRIIEHEKLYI